MKAGNKIILNAERQVLNTNIKLPGMKWHRFLINFALYTAAVCNLIIGILQITGMRYILNSHLYGNAVMIPEQMYFYYPALKITDILYSVTIILMAVYQIIIRFLLARGKKHAVLNLNIMIGIMCAVSALYDFLFQTIVRNELFVNATINYSTASVTLTTAIIIGAGLCVTNWYYYKKRKSILLNKI
ncbi:MAG: hypothetical protein IKI97_04145 [Clostridia bacterium]|nr:hypothetical protein [Clostridia bacterium]